MHLSVCHTWVLIQNYNHKNVVYTFSSPETSFLTPNFVPRSQENVPCEGCNKTGLGKDKFMKVSDKVYRITVKPRTKLIVPPGIRID